MNEDEVFDISNQNLWNAMTFNKIQTNLTDNISYIDLSTNHVSLESAKLLSDFIKNENSKLLGLSMISTHLTTRAATEIFLAIGKSKLIEVYFDNNIFVAEACKVLGESLLLGPPLELISLNGCNIPSEGCIEIANSLPALKNLVHFRMESNSIFDPGAIAIAKAIPSSSFTHLSIADNQIWMEGMTTLLNAVSQENRIISLDLSYNIVNLNQLAEMLNKSCSLQELALSGCKIKTREEYVHLINALKNSNISKLIIDGFNFHYLPVSWPKVTDSLFADNELFELTKTALLESSKLYDVRFGFMDLDQIIVLRNEYNRNKKELYLSLHDFARTGNCWVIKFPKFEVEAPVGVFKWNSKILTEDSAKALSQIFINSEFDDKPLQSLELTNCSITTEILAHILDGFDNVSLDVLDISNNLFDNSSSDTLIRFFSKNSARELRVEQCKEFTEVGLNPLLEFFRDNVDKCPVELSINIISSDTEDELAEHESFKIIADILKNGVEMESLCLGGTVSANDIKLLADALPGHEKFRELDIETDFMEKYRNPDPAIGEDVSISFLNMTKSLHNAFCNKKSSIRVFKFPLLTEIFIYCDKETMAMFHNIEAAIEKNTIEN